MTTVNVLISGNEMTSTIEGEGKAELAKVLDKMSDGYKWKLVVYKTPTLRPVDDILVPVKIKRTGKAGRNFFEDEK